VLLGGEGGEEGEGVVDEEPVRTGHQLAAVEAVALPLLRAHHLPAVQTVVY
jgi:hypothetical protein